MTALLLALAPAVAIRWITDQELNRSRDLWLLAVVGLSAAAVWPSAPWLTPILLWFLFRWRGIDQLPSLVTWASIGATWYLFRAIPEWAWSALPWAWLAIGCWHVFVLIWQYDCELLPGRDDIDQSRRIQTAPTWLERLAGHCVLQRSARPWGLLGSAPTTALYLALMVPFCPIWLLPVFGAGLWLTGSWLALVSAAVGLALVYPVALPVTIAVACGASVLIAVSLRHEGETVADDQRTKAYRFKHWIERTSPHGASLDGVRNRLNAHRVLMAVALSSPWRLNLMGRGPNTLEQELRRRGFELNLPVPESGCFDELLYLLWDYGAFGAAAVVLFAWSVWPGLRLGDSWTSALVVGALLALGHFPCRVPQVGLVWLAIAANIDVRTS